MTFNIEKCKVLHLGNNNPNYQYTMPMSGEAVHTLEVTIDYITHDSSIFNSARLNTLWVNIDGVQGMIIIFGTLSEQIYQLTFYPFFVLCTYIYVYVCYVL